MKYSVIPKSVAMAVAALATVGCNELGLEPTDAVSDDAYFQTIADFEAAIVGVYDQISIADYYGRSIPLISDIMGEDVKQAGSANRYQEFADFEGQVVTGHDFETELWAEGYEAINMLNELIAAEFEPTGVEDTYEQILGEAHALRGLIFFDLVRMYAQHYTFTTDASHPGIPIVLVPDVEALPSRNSVGEVYQQVISDLTMGISLMDQTRRGAYMMSAEAAQAILGRVYLYMEDWAGAESMATAVINSGKYSLVEGQAYIDQFATGGSSEAIFEIQSTDTDNRGSDSLGGMYRASGYGDYLPAKDLLDLMDPTDLRWAMYVEDPLLTGVYASHRVNKWPTVSNTDNIPVIRLSEVYLNRAEARAQLDDDPGAQDDLNMVRARAGLGDSADTGAALLDAILLERRMELGYEGHRIHDLMRYKQAINRVDVTGDVAFMAYPCNFCVLPIPQPETDTNPNIQQNAGY
ncbi:MAG TPA: RagB/SusD family nutrient uptake outer membrane protein [Longimicrobiales bacterium]|nr:RagB/SusD family nutrient uptake outer membrane protein [Longimicrobiales bacterium]